MTVDRSHLPKYRELMLPVLRAVVRLGGSGSAQEIVDEVVEESDYPDDWLSLTYNNRDESILLDRIAWARSYCKLGGALEAPKRGLYLLTELGQEISELSNADATAALLDLDQQVRRRRNRKKSETAAPNEEDGDAPDSVDDEDDETWKSELLERLHRLSPDAFERFSLYLLRSYGMRLDRQGGPGDEGIDGIGTAPLTDVLTTTVAVQAKRYEPSKAIGREVVALFQSDAIAAGAEHGVLITTARFSPAARTAAQGRTPTIDLIDGDRLAELCLQQEIGISIMPIVKRDWFGRFEE